MKRLFAIIIPLALAGCLEAGEPMVADYNGRIVKVQYHNFALGDEYKASPIYAKAVETCKLDGRDDAKYQGMRSVGDFSGEHVFLCI